MSDKIAKLALIPLALGALAMSGCATGPSQTSPSAEGAPSGWSYVGTNAAGDTFFIDYGTIRRKGAYAKAAQKQTWTTPELFCQGSNPARSARYVGEFDCRTGKTRRLHSTAFSGPDLDGEVVVGSDAVGPWGPVAPGTIGAKMLQAACNEAGKPGAQPPARALDRPGVHDDPGTDRGGAGAPVRRVGS